MTEIDNDNFSVFSKSPLNALGEILLIGQSHKILQEITD